MCGKNDNIGDNNDNIDDNDCDNHKLNVSSNFVDGDNNSDGDKMGDSGDYNANGGGQWRRHLLLCSCAHPLHRVLLCFSSQNNNRQEKHNLFNPEIWFSNPPLNVTKKNQHNSKKDKCKRPWSWCTKSGLSILKKPLQCNSCLHAMNSIFFFAK